MSVRVNAYGVGTAATSIRTKIRDAKRTIVSATSSSSIEGGVMENDLNPYYSDVRVPSDPGGLERGARYGEPTRPSSEYDPALDPDGKGWYTIAAGEPVYYSDRRLRASPGERAAMASCIGLAIGTPHSIEGGMKSTIWNKLCWFVSRLLPRRVVFHAHCLYMARPHSTVSGDGIEGVIRSP